MNHTLSMAFVCYPRSGLILHALSENLAWLSACATRRIYHFYLDTEGACSRHVPTLDTRGRQMFSVKTEIWGDRS